MPRDASGNYTLPSGNPVVTDTLITTSWANPTMSDLGSEITNSLDRQGRGGMLAPLRVPDGVVTAPGLGFTDATNTGLFRDSGDLAFARAGSERLRLGVDTATFAGSKILLSRGGVPLQNMLIDLEDASNTLNFQSDTAAEKPVVLDQSISAGNAATGFIFRFDGLTKAFQVFADRVNTALPFKVGGGIDDTPSAQFEVAGVIQCGQVGTSGQLNFGGISAGDESIRTNAASNVIGLYAGNAEMFRVSPTRVGTPTDFKVGGPAGSIPAARLDVEDTVFDVARITSTLASGAAIAPQIALVRDGGPGSAGDLGSSIIARVPDSVGAVVDAWRMYHETLSTSPGFVSSQINFQVSQGAGLVYRMSLGSGLFMAGNPDPGAARIAATQFVVGTQGGAAGTFTSADGKTVTVTGGIVTGIV